MTTQMNKCPIRAFWYWQSAPRLPGHSLLDEWEAPRLAFDGRALTFEQFVAHYDGEDVWQDLVRIYGLGDDASQDDADSAVDEDAQLSFESLGLPEKYNFDLDDMDPDDEEQVAICDEWLKWRDEKLEEAEAGVDLTPKELRRLSEKLGFNDWKKEVAK